MLHEQLRRLQWIAVALAVAGVARQIVQLFSRERTLSFALILAGLAFYTADNRWAQQRARR